LIAARSSSRDYGTKRRVILRCGSVTSGYHPAMNGRALVPYTPQHPKPKRKSNRDKEEAEDVVVVHETGDALCKLMAKAIAAAETMIKRPR